MGGTPRQTFRVSEYIWEQFQKKCASKGYTASEILRAFIMAVLKGEVDLKTLHPTSIRRGETLVDDDLILEWFRGHYAK